MTPSLRRVALLALGFWLASCRPTHLPLHGSLYDPPSPAPEFQVSTIDGSRIGLDNLAGSPTLLYFGFTSCPDFCPVVLADLAWVFDELGSQAAGARVLFVTVDPMTDTDERMAAYLQRFNRDFIGARASDDAALQAMLQSFGAYASVVPQPGHEPGGDSTHAISHTSRIFLIDAQGNLQTNYEFGTPREHLLADLQTVLTAR
jgi:protein SCO1/2